MKNTLPVLLLAVVCASCFADPQPPPGLDWLTPQLVEWVESIPRIGHWVTVFFQYVGFVAAFMTSLTMFVGAVMQAARAFAWAVKLQPLADRINAAWLKIAPVLAYLSIFNAPKKKPENVDLSLRDMQLK